MEPSQDPDRIMMAGSEALLEDGDRSYRSYLRWLISPSYIVYVMIAVLFTIFASTIHSKGFLSPDNLKNIVLAAIPIAVMAVAYVFVLSAGEIDLSIGSIVALSSLTSAVELGRHGFVVAVITGLGTGLIVGLANGVIVTKFRVPSFLVTLATLQLVGGLSQRVNNLAPIAVGGTFSNVFGGGFLFHISAMVIWAVSIGLGGLVLFSNTRFGAHVRATGDNRTAALTSGVRTDRVRIAVLALSGAAAGLTGMLYAGRLGAALYTLGQNDLLPVIAAAIIGGTSLTGGRGSVPGALSGALLLAMLNNALILMNLTVADQQTALGLILLIAVVLSLRERLA